MKTVTGWLPDEDVTSFVSDEETVTGWLPDEDITVWLPHEDGDWSAFC